MTSVLSFSNQKGGVAKSTSAMSFTYSLALSDKKVLIIDFDPQASLTMMMFSPNPNTLSITIADLMVKIINDKQITADEGIIHINNHIDLLPSNIQLSGIETMLVNTMSRENVLKTYINQVKHKYDYVIIDCMPSLGMLTINSLAASNSVIIPVQPHYLSVKGLELLLHTISKIKRQINPNLTIDGILMTIVDRRINFSKEIISLLHETYGGKIRIFKSEIPQSIKAVEASAVGKNIFEYDPKGKVAVAYEAFSKEVIALERCRSKNQIDQVR